MPKAPKELRRNLEYRKEILALGQTSKTARDEIRLACERDPIWFVDTFLWGFNPKDHAHSPERPFVTYGFQERLVNGVITSIGEHDLVVPKSRAVGGTYGILAAFFHQWMFRPMQSFLLASAKEDRVDRRGDPSCLFWKLTHFLDCLPAWLRPAYDRTDLRLENLEMGSIFNGESTNKNVDRGGRRTAILADEAAAMVEASKIAASIQHVTNCCVWLSTFQGAFGAFYDLYDKYQRECPEWVIKLGWWDHPVYSAGIYTDQDGRRRSPWYDKQCLRAPGPRWIAQELDMEPAAAGGQFFEQFLVERLLKTTCRPHSAIGELHFDETGEEPQFTPGSHGRLLLWLPQGERPPKGEYLIGCDIATGKGGEMSSQSAASVVEKNTGEKVAEFKHNRITPTNFGRYVAGLGRWFHDARVIWGSQGLGDFGVTLQRDCHYGNIYRRPGEKRKIGFVESPESKYELFSKYRDALNEGRFVNRSKDAIEECKQFIYANGTVEHSKAIQGDQDPENKGKLHGDIVVADAMANHLLPFQTRSETKSEGPPPIGSPAWHLQEYLREKRQKDYY